MMFALADIRDYIAGLGIAGDDHVYMGKLDNKQPQSIGIYHRRTDGKPNIALGGYDSTTYDVKPVSILIHWGKSPREAERAALQLFEKLKKVTSLNIGGTYVNFIRLMVPEPQDVGADDNGVCEYVIWLDFIYERKRL